MPDWNVVDLPSVFCRVVRSYDAGGQEVIDDGEWHRQVSEMHFVLAEFLARKSLISDDIDTSRQPELVIRHSQLTELGKAFDKALEIDKWMQSFDRAAPGAAITSEGLERRWRKFVKRTTQQQDVGQEGAS